MARLRAPGGCPWDREQTLRSIQPYTVEETYEVLEAIDQNDMRALAEELGDYLLQAVFYAQIASEGGHFTIADSLAAINAKLIRRHPHVFGDGDAKTPNQVIQRWDEIKKAEKAARGEGSKGILDSVPKALPALHQAQDLTYKAAKVGFDWPDPGPVWAKVREELTELEQAMAANDLQHAREELGDLLFALVNLARHLKLDAEQSLRGANAKFRRRFSYIEQRLAERGRTPADSNLEEMDELWNQAKRV